jgi:hypothetical protein
MDRILFTTVCAAAALIVACSSSSDGDGEPGQDTGSPGSTTASLIRSIPGTSEWPTDWSTRSVDLDELRVGLPGRNDMRDGIPPIDGPIFESTGSATDWLERREPVVMLELEGRARAYPLGLLISREIVNDDFAGTPVAITYCPLCNSAVGFDRRVDGQTLRFGVSGLLRNSDLVMWDDATVSLWQQITGEAIVGELTGTQLRLIPTPIISFGDFADRYPDGEVLSREVNGGFYGSNPYASYDSVSRPFLFDGDLDERFPAMERVVGVVVDGETKAFPFSVLEDVRAANDELARVPIVVMWGAPETVSALDAPKILDSDAVGTGVAYERTLRDQVLTFEALPDGLFRDVETGSTWNILGKAMSGPLANQELAPIVQTNHFWFAWAAFNPDSPVWVR